MNPTELARETQAKWDRAAANFDLMTGYGPE